MSDIVYADIAVCEQKSQNLQDQPTRRSSLVYADIAGSEQKSQNLQDQPTRPSSLVYADLEDCEHKAQNAQDKPTKPLIYAELDFSDRKPRNKPIQRSPVVYSQIDFTKKAPPRPASVIDLPSPAPELPPARYKLHQHGRYKDPPPPPPLSETLPSPPPELPPAKYKLHQHGRYKDPPPPPPLSETLPSPSQDRLPQAPHEYFPPPPRISKRLPPASFEQLLGASNDCRPSPPPRGHSVRQAQSKSMPDACNFQSVSPKQETRAGVELFPEDPVKPDPEFQSDNIYSLNNDNFDLFLRCRDVAMVLFYTPHDMAENQQLRTNYIKAANSTKKWNHGYAAVNCQLYQDLCNTHKVLRTPMFTIFSYSKPIGTFRVLSMDAETIRKFVENTPVVRI